MSTRTRLLAALAAAAVTGLALARLARARRTVRTPVGIEGPIGRASYIAEHVVRAGSGVAVDQARKVFADADQREAIDAARQLHTVEQVAVVMGDLKGAFMKLGQMASFLDPELTPQLRALLAPLQQDAPPMSPELAADVIRAELGGSPDDLFAEWDPTPLASASIGQVHRARSHDGRLLAVKVQYPGVDRAIRSDLDAAVLLLKGAGRLFPGVDVDALLGEVRERVLEELDYRSEADNQMGFADAYAGHPHIHVPTVDRDLSTGRVLVSELVSGARLSEAVTWEQGERDLAGETIFRFVFGSLYRLRAFNGDPHPGNFLFHGAGRVTFLDFGMVKRFEPGALAPLAAIVAARQDGGDAAALRRAVEAAGFLPLGVPVSDAEVAAYFEHFFEIVAHPGPLTVTPEYARESLRRYFALDGEHRDLVAACGIPKDYVILQRIQLGITALLADLAATADWATIYREWLPDGPGVPTTPLGEADATWFRGREGAT